MFGRQLEALCERAYDQAQMLKKTVSIRFWSRFFGSIRYLPPKKRNRSKLLKTGQASLGFYANLEVDLKVVYDPLSHSF
jgi:hypothetical protein